MEQEMQGGDRKCVTLALSKEHNPTIYEERMRIQRAGGTVRYWAFTGLSYLFSVNLCLEKTINNKNHL